MSRIASAGQQFISVVPSDNGVDGAGVDPIEVEIEQLAAGDLAAVQGAELDVGGLVGQDGGHADARAAYRAEQLAQGFNGTAAAGNPGCTSPTTLGHHVRFQVDCRTAAPSLPRAGTPGRKQVPSPVPGHKVPFGFCARGPYAWKPEPDGKAYGQWIGLHADNGHISTYCHLSERQVKAGQKVSAGRQLGKVGATGNTTGGASALRDVEGLHLVLRRCRRAQVVSV